MRSNCQLYCQTSADILSLAPLPCKRPKSFPLANLSPSNPILSFNGDKAAMLGVSSVQRPHAKEKRDVDPAQTSLFQSTSSPLVLSEPEAATLSTSTKAAAAVAATTSSRPLDTYILGHDPTLTLNSFPTILTTKTPSSAPKVSTTPSISEDSLFPILGKKTKTSTSEKSLVTVYTQLHATGSLVPSIEWIIPTITTNSLPSGYSALSSSNSSSPSCIYASCQSPYSYSSQHTKGSLSSSDFSSSLEIVSTFIDPILSKSSSSATRSKKPMFSSRPTDSSSQPSLSYLHSLLPTTTPPTTSSSSTSSSSSSSEGTTTVTQYLEGLTYTQVYIVTDSKLTLTTSLLATTSFYVDSMSSTFSLSPAAITTDIAALKSRPDFDTIFEKKMSGGTVAGIAIGSIFGFLLLLTFFLIFLKRKRQGGKPLMSLFTKDTELASSNHYGSAYVQDNDDDDVYDDRDYDCSEDQRVINAPPRIMVNSQHIQPNGGASIKAPPIPSRSNKPVLQTPPMLYVNTFPVGSPTTLSHQTPVHTPMATETHNENQNDEEQDLSLFDMKSTLSAINASSEVNHHLMPPIPPTRKSLSSNRIDKLNYKVDQITPSPSSQLPIDRTMGVLYESPNEQCIWDEFEGAKNLGLMCNVGRDSPIDSVFGPFEADMSNYDQKKQHYLEQLNVNLDIDNNIKNSILNSTRVRSGSGAKRYEYLANNVNIIKHEVQRERLASPLSINKPEIKVTGDGDEEKLFQGLATNNDTISPISRSNVPPPVPKPRKNINSIN